ncbi:hypothetical protein FQN49_003098 [Arthroderma sp. PD_2]|nr:hypothetical protein FQN49_003098 [Arthroderma sp. PD_2]
MHTGKPPVISNFALELPICTATKTGKGLTLQTESQRAQSQGSEKVIHAEWTDWQLWDDRYWIRIRARAGIQQYDREREERKHGYKSLRRRSYQFPKYHSSNPVIPIRLRALAPRDLTGIRKMLGVAIKRSSNIENEKGGSAMGEDPFLSPSSRLGQYPLPRPSSTIGTLPNELAPMLPMSPTTFQQLLASLAPGKVRFTVPLLTVAAPEDEVSEGSENPKEQLLGLPSLPISLPTKVLVDTPVFDAHSGSRTSTLDVSWKVEWEMRYKWIDPNTVRAVNW